MTGPRRLATREFLRLWAGAFPFFLSFYLLLPTIPLYARSLGIPESEIGLIIGFFALSSMAVRPWAGWAADRYGRLSLLVAGTLFFLASSLLYGWNRSMGALLAVHIVHGAGIRSSGARPWAPSSPRSSWGSEPAPASSWGAPGFPPRSWWPGPWP